MAGSKTMKVMQVSKANGPFELVTRPIPEPGPNQVRVKVQACGICHSDSLAVSGAMFPRFPAVPGHEVIGLVDALGAGVEEWKAGQRVGLGWYGGHCGKCERCRRGDFILCESGAIPGLTFDGGYQEYLIAPTQGLAAVPDSLDSVEAAPLLCAGITCFNAIRNSGAKAGDTVAILGIGGLGHLGIQYAAKMGYRVVAIARGADKAAFAKKLGAHHYIDSTKEDPAQALLKLGGAKTILSTVINADAISAAIGGLGLYGNFVIVGVDFKPIQVNILPLLRGKQKITAWASGASIDSEDTLKFSELTGVKTMVEVFPLEKAQEAYDLMMSGKARFRCVLKVD
ncbi:MAG TPA: alcohol dehydrogenase [bacterium]|jgi:D-arabinose 1-dehydrogenase-like Zn-dependent alcohol dehydrogenase|nr:alcohol dehydrogenase [bacterium]